MNRFTRITVDVHLQDDTPMFVADHLDEPTPFVTVRIADANHLFIYNVTQAEKLRDAAQDALDAFVLAGEPVTA